MMQLAANALVITVGRVIGWMMRGLNDRYLAQEMDGIKRRSEDRALGHVVRRCLLARPPAVLARSISRRAAFGAAPPNER